MPAHQPANLASDPIGSGEGAEIRRTGREGARRPNTPNTISRWAKLGSGGTRPQVASNEQASKTKRKPTHTARSTSEYAAHQPSARPAGEERQNPERVLGAVDPLPQPKRGQAGGGDRQEEVAAAAPGTDQTHGQARTIPSLPPVGLSHRSEKASHAGPTAPRDSRRPVLRRLRRGRGFPQSSQGTAHARKTSWCVGAAPNAYCSAGAPNHPITGKENHSGGSHQNAQPDA